MKSDPSFFPKLLRVQKSISYDYAQGFPYVKDFFQMSCSQIHLTLDNTIMKILNYLKILKLLSTRFIVVKT